MRTTWVGSLRIIIMLVIGLMALALAKNDPIGKINFILGAPGDVRLVRAGSASWESAKLYGTIYNGDQLKTAQESRCEIKLAENRGLIRIGENTNFIFQQDQLANKFNSELSKGRIWANIRHVGQKGQFQLKTPTAVCAIRGTIYRIDADSTTRVLVYQGAVDVGPLWAVKSDSSRPGEPRILQQPYEVPGPTQVPGPYEVSLEQWVRIVAGQQIEIRGDGKYNKTSIDQQIDSNDDWVQWNKRRDGLE
ncbi:MAG: FecR family protein [candidate division KSB1 bacterium]|nr:FecR family protein [candidate division KSB1 bacterium]MDZ7318203.1 FecR family protein [candidate division KSB1 bacterium]MDZ7341596.1 FecR family protein [candidate division KSB1 bacterium]